MQFADVKTDIAFRKIFGNEPHKEIPELKEAYAQARMNTWSQEELDVYEYWQIRDAADRYGLEAKFDRGRAEGKIEIALKMRQKGMEIVEVMEMTGLSREDIERLMP
jgi:predicted transposase/invertase (TIGR01784 family)